MLRGELAVRSSLLLCCLLEIIEEMRGTAHIYLKKIKLRVINHGGRF